MIVKNYGTRIYLTIEWYTGIYDSHMVNFQCVWNQKILTVF